MALPDTAAAPPSTPRAAVAGYTPRHLAERILQTRAALEGERKQVTVLFCDIANSTPIAAAIGAERMHGVLNGFFELALAQVHRFEGTVNQFLGDGLMALFGAPLAHEDHARRAVLAALAIRDALAARNAQLAANDERLEVRIGLHTGLVVVGQIGDNLRMDYTAIGDTTNVAARLQGHAEPGTILISANVLRHVRRFVDVEELGARRLKGKSEPLTLYIVLNEQGAGASAVPVSTPLVGRSQELDLLRGALDRLALTEQGGIVTLIGEAGLGKSRLLEEVRGIARELPLRCIEAHCLSFGRTLSYWPFREALRQSFNIDAERTDPDLLDKVRERMQRLFGADAEQALPFVARLMSLTLPDEQAARLAQLDALTIGHQIFATMLRLLELLSDKQPLAIFLEDWHWADDSSAALLQHLLQLAARAPVLFVIAMRPDAHGPAATLAQTLRQETLAGRTRSVVLTPLSNSAADGLIAHLLDNDSLAPHVQSQLKARAAGNPFYLGELVRALIATGAIVREARGEGWHSTGRFASLPDTIEDVILARIDRLEDEAKQALKTAAVVGRTFFYRILKALMNEEAQLDLDIDQLESANMIAERQRLPERELMFRHPLIQEAAYGSLLAERRKQLHRQVGRCLQTLFPNRIEEFASVLAHHFAQAEDWDKALEYLFKAGDQAGAMSADAEAIAHYQAALQAIEHAQHATLEPVRRADLYRKLGQAYFRLGKYEESVVFLVRALSLIGIRYPTGGRAVAIVTVQEVCRQLAGQMQRKLLRRPVHDAFTEAQRGVAFRALEILLHINVIRAPAHFPMGVLIGFRISAAGATLADQAIFRSAVGMVLDQVGLRRLSGRFYDQALAIAERAERPYARGQCAMLSGLHAYSAGRWDDAQALFQHGAALLDAVGLLHYWAECVSLDLLMRSARGESAYDGPIALTMDVAARAGDTHVMGWFAGHQGDVLLRRGEYAQAVERFREACQILESIPDFVGLSRALAYWARCELALGNDAQALALIERGERLRAQHTIRWLFATPSIMAAAQIFLTLAERARGRDAKAMWRLAAKACGAALRHGRACLDEGAPDAKRLQAQLAWHRGRKREAEVAWRAGVALAERLGARYVLAQLHFARGTRRRDAEDLRRATTLFAACGAQDEQREAERTYAEILAPERALHR